MEELVEGVQKGELGTIARGARRWRAIKSFNELIEERSMHECFPPWLCPSLWFGRG
ncbi:hypothetical protein DsansV1_C08g0081821 [Dioscorea sansibarensis]